MTKLLGYLGILTAYPGHLGSRAFRVPRQKKPLGTTRGAFSLLLEVAQLPAVRAMQAAPPQQRHAAAAAAAAAATAGGASRERNRGSRPGR